MKDVIDSALFLGMAIGYLFTFSKIAYQGDVRIYEPRKVVLATELALFAGISTYGAVKFVQAFRG